MNSSDVEVLSVPGLHRLVARWVDGWVVSRAGSRSVAVDGGFDVVVAGSPTRGRELVLVEPSPAALRQYAAGVAARPGGWLTVLTREPVAAPAPDGYRVELVGERLMSVDLVTPAAGLATGPAGVGPGVEADVEAGVEVVGGRVVVTLRRHGTVVAAGQVGLAGVTAVVDRVQVEEAFRRRGLGRRLMAELTAAALRGGATSGVLAASLDGQALYATLGWSPRAAMVTYAPDGQA